MWNINHTFRKELRSPDHQTAAKATLLDTGFHEIPDGDFFTAGADDFQDYLVDGVVDLDITRGTRRTANITILNKNGEFTPDGTSADYDGKFYVNRNIRLYRGIVHGETTMYAPLGTFMVDAIDVVVERNMSNMNLTLSDHWKKFNKSLVTRTKTYAAGAWINNVILDMAAVAGADYPLPPMLDHMEERTTAAKQLSTKLVLERGDNRGEVLKDLANKYGLDLFFNVEGRLVSNDRKAPDDRKEVWHFYSSTESQFLGMLIGVRKTISDDNLYNHVFVIGLGDEKNPVIYEAKNETPGSTTNISRIGDRVRILESQKWKTYDAVRDAGLKLWERRYNLFEEIQADVICNPALDVDDVVRITEKNFAKIDGIYRIKQMNVPLTTSKQTLVMSRNVYL